MNELISMSTLAINVVIDIENALKAVSETANKPDGDTWRHQITGIEHARLVNTAHNRSMMGRIYGYCTVLRTMGFEVECNDWIESNQMTGCDADHITIDGVKLSDRKKVIAVIEHLLGK